MEVLLVPNLRLGLVEAAQNVVAIGINGRSTMRGAAGQHRIKTRQRTQRLSAKVRDCDSQRLKPGKVLMLMMFSHFAHLASQVCGQNAKLSKVFADVYGRGETPGFSFRQRSVLQRRKDRLIEGELQFLNGYGGFQ